MKLQARCD